MPALRSLVRPPPGAPLVRRLLRADGTWLDLPAGTTLEDVRQLIGATALDTVALTHLGDPLHVMLVDDLGYETVLVEQTEAHFERLPIRARQPVNAQATKLFLANCRPALARQILGDVVILPEEDFDV